MSANRPPRVVSPPAPDDHRESVPEALWAGLVALLAVAAWACALALWAA